MVRNMKKIEIKQRELSLRLMTCTCACACGDGLGGVYDGGWGDGMWMKCLMLSQLEGRGSERGGNR